MRQRKTLFPPLIKSQITYHITIEKGHGRVETREIFVLPIIHKIQGWPSVAQICKVRRKRFVCADNKESIADFYFITSLSPKAASAPQLLDKVRAHWAIENNLHWVKDVILNEDRATNRKKLSPRNMASVRNCVLFLLEKQGLKPKAGREHLAQNQQKAINLVSCGYIK